MSSITRNVHSTGSQHEELGHSRITRDQQDHNRILNWVEEVNPFDTIRNQLQSLSTGLTANESVNCDDSEVVEQRIQTKMDNQSIVNCSIKHSDQVTTLGSLKNIVKVDKEAINIDPSKLFSRLLVLSDRDGEVKEQFQYELTPILTSLFADNFMRKPNKSQIIKHLFGKDYQHIHHSEIQETERNVVDGGALLRQTTWPDKVSFGEIVDSYSRYTMSKYGISTIVFDGYEKKPSVKDHEHERRSSSKCHNFNLQRKTILTVSQKSFLTNSHNKTELLKLLLLKLISDGHTVLKAISDADMIIVKTVLQIASNGNSVTVFPNDTDIIVMLAHHWKEGMATVLVRSDICRKGYMTAKQLNIGEVSQLLRSDIKDLLLFIHAFGGCDTTSAIFEKGKGLLVKLLEKSTEAKKVEACFQNNYASKEEIGIAGKTIFALLYNGNKDDSLQTL